MAKYFDEIYSYVLFSKVKLFFQNADDETLVYHFLTPQIFKDEGFTQTKYR
jgi:hypothetical protein